MNYTYMSFLGTDDYLIGILALKKQLDAVKSKYPFVVLVSDQISNNSKKILDKYHITYISKDQYIPSESIKKYNQSFGMPQWSNTFGKLYIFGMTQFDKIVYVDADMLIKKNIDELFQKENLSSVIAGTRYPGNEDWSQTLNSGLMVIVPKKDEDRRLFKLIDREDHKKGLGDQDVLHIAYPNWIQAQQLHLGEEYNLLAPYESYYLAKGLVKYENLKVIHYIGPTKPWMISYILKLKHMLGIVVYGMQTKSSFISIKYSLKDYRDYYSLCNKIKSNVYDAK